MRVALAVKDYKEMFPEEYDMLMLAIQDQRDNLRDDMATLKDTNAVKRALVTLSDKLYGMINLKLDEQDQMDWSSLETQRWFCKTFPEFAVTKHV